jgi:hypothetical protein
MRWCILACFTLYITGIGRATPILAPATFSQIGILGGPSGSPVEIAMALVPYSNTLIVPGVQNAVVSVSATGAASYGSLHADLTMSLSDPSRQAQASGFLSSVWRDIWTITFGDLTGLGYLELQYAVDGTLSSSASGRSTPNILSDVWSPTISTQSENVNLTGGDQIVTMPQFYMFHYGESFNVSAQLSALIQLGTGNGAGSVDYANTATLNGIQVFDASMNPVADFAISSASGTLYGPDGIVAEPSSLSMGLFGTAVIALNFLKKSPTKKRRG